MTILEALIQLRNDLKLWVTNNLRVKLNKNLGTDESGKFLTVDETGDIVTTSIDITDTVVDGQYVSSVSQTNGKITVSRASLPDYSSTYAPLSHTHTASDIEYEQTGDSVEESLDALYTRVTSLESSLISGTAIDPTGTYDKVYFNTSKSIDEVVSILSQLPYYDLNAYGFDIPCYVCYASSDLKYGIIIGCPVTNENYFIISLVINGDSNNYIFSKYNNMIGTDGWQTFDNPYSISLTNGTLGVDGNNIIGQQNELLKDLISATPFKSGLSNAIIDVVELPSPVTKNAIDPLGTYDKIYLNKTLSAQEVIDYFNNNLTFEFLDDNTDFYIIYFDSINSRSLGIIRQHIYDSDNAYVNDMVMFVECYVDLETFNIVFDGTANVLINPRLADDFDTTGNIEYEWNNEFSNPFSLSLVNGVSSIQDIVPVGQQNDLLKDLIYVEEVDETFNDKALYRTSNGILYHYANGQWKAVDSATVTPYATIEYVDAQLNTIDTRLDTLESSSGGSGLTENGTLSKATITDFYSSFINANSGGYVNTSDVVDCVQDYLNGNLGGSGGGSTVSVNASYSSGTAIGDITVDGTTTTLYVPASSDGSTVSVDALYTSGTAIGKITVDGTETTLYAPTSDGGSGGLTDGFDIQSATMEDLSLGTLTSKQSNESIAVDDLIDKIADFETRLSELGFKEGVATIYNSDGYGDSLSDYIVVNSLRKQGKYVQLNLEIYSTTVPTLAPENGWLCIEVPDEFKPKEGSTILVCTENIGASTTGIYKDYQWATWDSGVGRFKILATSTDPICSLYATTCWECD